MLKSVPKKDQPKVIALSVLVAGLAGTAFFQLNSGDPRIAEAAAARAATKNEPGAAGKTATASAARSGARTPTQLVSSSGAGAAMGAAGGDTATASLTRVVGDNGTVFDLGMVGPPVGGKDPFTPVGLATAAVPKPTAPTIAAVATPAPPPPNFAAGRLDNLLNRAGITSTIPKQVGRGGVSINEVMNGGGVAGGTPGFPAGATGAPVAVALPPPPPPSVMVTGIVVGVAEPGFPVSQNIAVVRGADASTAGMGERRFVKVGDSVGNGFVVAKVKSDAIVIKSGKQVVTLRVGEKLGALGGAAVTPPAGAAVPGMGKDEPKNTDKNTSERNAVFSGAGQAAGTAAPAAAGLPLGENFRAK